MSSTSRPPFPWLTTVGVLAGVLCVLALVAGLLLLATPKTESSDKPTRATLKSEDDARLSKYGWVEKPGNGKAGIVHIPTNRAAELMLKERGEK